MKEFTKKMNKQGLYFLFVIAITFTLNNKLSAQNILKGPYLLKPGDKNMTIRYEFDSKSDFVLEFGKNKKSPKEVKLVFRESKNGGNLYEANLSNLKPNTTYYYRLLKPSTDEWFSFKTYLSGQQKFSFVAMGDSRSHPDIFTKIMQETEGVHPDFIISMGDLVEVGADYEEWKNFYFSVVKGFVESTPIVSTLGDHETNGDNGDLFRYFLRNNETVDKQWFSFDYGDAHFISLDFRHPDDQEMIDWFIKDITSANKKWNFVYMHRPTYNFGGHRSDWGIDTWPDLYRKYKVDIVFAGHSHLYERFYPVRPDNEKNGFAVTYITTGGAGAGLYESVKNKSLLAVTESVNHFVDVKIDGNTLKLKAIRMDGSLLDELEIIKNKKGYNKAYENAIVSQEKLNTITGLNSAISNNLSDIPLFTVPARYHLNLRSYTSEAIPFSVQIMDKSAECYKVEAFKDTLQAHERKEVSFDVYRVKDISVSTWGTLTPELRLKLIYEYNSKTDTIISKRINYWPDHDY